MDDAKQAAKAKVFAAKEEARKLGRKRSKLQYPRGVRVVLKR